MLLCVHACVHVFYPQANDFGGEIIPKAAEMGLNVMAYPFYGYWEDIGTIKSFFEENLKLCRHVSQGGAGAEWKWEWRDGWKPCMHACKPVHIRGVT